MGGPERSDIFRKFVPPAGMRPSFRSLAKIAELLGADRPSKTLELVQNLARVVATSITKRLQAAYESRTMLHGFRDQGA